MAQSGDLGAGEIGRIIANVRLERFAIGDAVGMILARWCWRSGWNLRVLALVKPRDALNGPTHLVIRQRRPATLAVPTQEEL